MRFEFSDFIDPAIDPLNENFQSVLPGEDLLRDSMLDPGLPSTTDVTGVAGPALRRMLYEKASLDALHLEQYSLFDVSATVGILSEYKGVVDGMLQAVSISIVQGTNIKIMAREMAQTAIGAVAEGLTYSGNIYAQVAGAVIGLANMLWNVFEKGPEALPTGSLPTQEYDQDTDQGQFNTTVRASLRMAEWTPLFLPRFQGDPTLQYRETAAGRRSLAIALGDGEIGQNAQFRSAKYNYETCMGFMPGSQRITSVLQSVFMERPRPNGPPYYDTRKGSCVFGDDVKAAGQDVGTFYPSSSQGLFMVWNAMQKPSPAMYTLNALEALVRWHDYAEAMFDGFQFWWDKRDLMGFWGAGAYRCALKEAVDHLTVNRSGKVGPGLGGWSPQTDSGSLDKGRWKEFNFYEQIVKPALNTFMLRQAWFLHNTNVAAYIAPDSGVYNHPEMATLVDNAQKRILNTPRSVKLEDITDEAYKREIAQARIRQITSVPPEPTKPYSGDIVILGDPDDEPPTPPPPKGGPPFGEWIPTPPPEHIDHLSKYVPAAALGGAGLLTWYLISKARTP